MTGVHRSEAWLQAQLSKSTTRRHPPGRPSTLDDHRPANQQVKHVDVKRGMNGLGRLRKRKGPNKTEAAFGQWLQLFSLHKPRRVEFEAMTLKMPGGTRYTPDWCVEDQEHRVSFYECKGHMREAARVRLKEFAAHFTMFRFFLVRANDRRLLSWDIREVGQ